MGQSGVGGNHEYAAYSVDGSTNVRLATTPAPGLCLLGNA